MELHHHYHQVEKYKEKEEIKEDWLIVDRVVKKAIMKDHYPVLQTLEGLYSHQKI